MTSRLALVLALGLALVAIPALAAESKAPQASSMSSEEQAMMQKWMAFATPGDGHKALAAKVGVWNGTVKMWMAPGAPPAESTGTSTFEMILDGRYLQDTTEGTANGQPFHGRGLTAYDNLKKKYVATWIDNMGTGIMVAEGTYDPLTKTFKYKSEAPDVVAGKYAPVRSVEKILSNDKWIMEMYGKAADGKEFRTMEITYTRKK